ncbi:filamentous haemagglutinin family protein [Sphingopyxis fribergensis]
MLTPNFFNAPARKRIARLSRAALAASVSISSLLVMASQPAIAQEAGTLPGTQVLQGGRWTGAKLPTVAQGNNGLVMTIEQEQKRALLDWSRFDVGKNEEVHFQQQGTDWIALNRIFDSKPSEIAGKITAKGQVWLQNSNGIIFKDGAQINAHSILATALPITENQLYNGLLSGNGVIRGEAANPLFPSQNIGMVPRPPVGLDPNSLLGQAPAPVAGERPSIMDFLARAAIRIAILRANGMEGVDQYNSGYGIDTLSYYDAAKGRTVYFVNPDFANVGLGAVLESIIATIDVSKMGEYDYSNFTNISQFWTGVSWQGIPAGSQTIPQSLRDEVAAQIKTQFVDQYSARLATTQQNYSNYLANSRITVERGATLTASSSDSASPGKIMLFGPNVSNAGKLTAHDGQVLLAAGEQVKLSAGQTFTNSARGGLAVNVMATGITDAYGSYPGIPCCRPEARLEWEADYLDRADEVGMTAANSGEILADRGAVTMVGANVDQLGDIRVTNGVRQRNGTIVLQASHGFMISEYSVGGNYFAGKVTLGEDSVTSITPDTSDITGLAADSFAKGRVLIAGKDIVLEKNASVISRSGEVVIHASPSGVGERGGSSPGATDGSVTEQRGDKGSFVMKSGALIDVSGLRDVERSVADNIFAVEVRSNEVSASPKQRDGILVGETVYVDRRDGAAIVDWTGALAGEQRTAEQMSTKGGTVRIRASEYAVVEDGATIDVSGGSTKYTDAEVTVTRLQDSFGRFHNISDADPNLRYVGISKATRLEKGYVEGADAGAVELLSGSSRLFGKLRGDVVTGDRQVMAALGQIRAPRVPAGAVGASLVGTIGLPKAGSAALHRGGPEYSPWSSTYSFIVADEKAFTGTLWTETENNGPFIESDPMLLDPFAVGTSYGDQSYDESDPLWMSKGTYENGQPRWISYVEDDFFSGMGEVVFGYGSGHQTQTINPGVSIRLAPGGSFLTGSENGVGTVGNNVSIIAPSGNIGLAAANGMTIGSDVLLSVAAPWINDVDAPANAIRGYVDGGDISLLAATLTGDITLDAGGGGWYQRVKPGQNSQGQGASTRFNEGDFRLIEGKGGSIALGGGGQTVGAILDVADISLGGLGGGGTLSLLASGDVVVGPVGGSAGDAEYIDETLFRDMGVGSLALGADTLTIASGANLLFQTRNMRFRGRAYDVASGSDLRDVTDLTLLPPHLRQGGSLQLFGDAITIEAGALVEVDPLGSIVLDASQIRVDGTLRAHGGSITVGGTSASSIHLGNGSLLDATGIAQTVKVPGGADGRGFWYDGRIVDGGTVSVDGSHVVMDAGATIDVSGASGLLSVLQPGRYAVVKVNQVIGSDAGTIGLGADAGYLLGNLRGEAGSQYNYGGKLDIAGGFDGKLLLPEYTDWSTGEPGLQSILDNLQYAFYPEPTPEEPISLRQFFADNYSWLAPQLGFEPGEIEDIQITSIAEFTDFVRTVLSPLVKTNPSDADGALVLDPDMTVVPDVPPPSRYAFPDGYEPADMAAFDRSMAFVLTALGGVQNPAELARGSRTTIGGNILRDMKRFDTLSIAGKLESDQAIDISSQRVLTVAGGFNGTQDMSFSSRNVYLTGGGGNGFVPKDANSGTLTVSGEMVEIAGKFEVGGFEKVVIAAEGDMRGGFGVVAGQPVPESGEITPGIHTTGDLVLRAAQIYPTTDGVLRFDSDRSIRVEQTGRSAAPLSAGGTLILEAPKIEQAGTLRAPFGEIRLTATGYSVTGEDGAETFVPGSVALLPGSVTSTAADGRTILYGYTYDGQSWYAPTSAETTGPTELSTPPEKRVSLSGDIIDVQEGATIDVSGSGDVLGLEFVAGPLGQTNILDVPGNYAIVPAYGNGIVAPIDPLYNPGTSSDTVNGGTTPGHLPLGSSVWLAAFDGNPAGWYTLLPAEYALTPGGYLLSLAGDTPMTTEARRASDDSFVVLGRRGVSGTGIADQTLSTWKLTSGGDVRKRSEFFETYGNSFFSSERFLEGLLRSGNPYNADPRLPVDGGFLTLAANSSLKLDGTILAGGATGVTGARGGIVDITSDNIVIAAPGTDVSDLAGYLVLDPSKISNIAESILIGGVRRQGQSGLEVVTGQYTRDSADEVRSPEKSVGAENVVVRTDAANPLTGTELLFAANNSVRVESGSVIRAVGDGTDASNIAIAPSMPAYFNQQGQLEAAAEDRGGAFLRVSNLGDITVSRENVQSVAGDMIVEAGAVLEAADSVLLDSTENTIVGNGAVIKAGAITAAAGLVSLGAVPQGTEGLVFSGATLAGLTTADKLTLKSYSTIDFYGDVSLDLTGSVALDGAAFVSRGDTPGNVSITAGRLELRNSDAAAVDATGNGGTLALAGKNIVMGEGEVDLVFDATTMDAEQRVVFAGLGESRYDGALTIRAAEITGESGAGHVVTAAGAVELRGNGNTAALPAFASAGALLDFRGTDVLIDASIRAGSGTVRATASEGDVRLASGAKIDVGGADVSFFEVQGFLPGGSIQLTSVNGDTLVEEGALLNVSGGSAGGDAGTIALSAGRGVVLLDGTLKADVAGGYRTGSFALTTSTLDDFGGLNAKLNDWGFSRRRDFAILDGDVLLNGTTRVDALRIVTGNGDISVASDAVLGSDSAKGGKILLASGGDLIVADGARFDVSAKGADQRGGSLDLQVTVGGNIDVGNASIDVSGKGKGQGGDVRLRAAQTGNDVAVSRWDADVSGGDTQLEAFRVYDLDDADGDASNGHLAEIDTALQQQVIADATAFMDANGTGIRARLGQTGNAAFQLVPGIELRSEGDMDLVHNWNFKNARFDDKGGVLTLRAGGDLTINANLSDGFVDGHATPDAVLPTDLPYGWTPGAAPLPDAPASDFTNDDSWSYNLVAGADFAQTNVLSTQTGSGGAIEVGGLVRSGTGDINVAASGDLTYEKASLINYQGSWNESDPAARITVPKGTPVADGTILKPTSYASADGAGRTIYPELPAGTVLRKGTKVPAGTEMPDGSVLAVDTVLTSDVTLTANTRFPGEVVIAGKTYLGSDLIWEIASNRSNDPSAPVQMRVPASIAGLGDLEVRVVVGGTGDVALLLADGRYIADNSSFGFEDVRPVEMVNGAIYTVGIEDAPVANYIDKTHVGFSSNNAPGIIAHRSYMTNGGDVNVNVGGAITGAGTILENYRWMVASGATPTTALFGYNYPGKNPDALFNMEFAQYQPDQTGQTALSLLADRFTQGIGALGGGDVSITSGGDVDNLVVALPTWVRVSGGTVDMPTKTLHLSGGGDLVMNVGQNMKGGLVQVGKGRATIDVAGSVIATDQRTGIALALDNAAYLQLAIDDAQLSLQAGGDVNLRGVSSMLGATSLPLWLSGQYGSNGNEPSWLGYTADTSLRVTSLGGDINYRTQSGANGGVNILPSQTALVATAGSINFGMKEKAGARVIVDMWHDTRLDLLAQQNIQFRLAGNYDGAGFIIGYADPLWVPRAINPGSNNFSSGLFQSTITQDPLNGHWMFNQAGPGYGIDGPNVHSGSSSYSRIYAAQGDMIGWDEGYDINPNGGNGMHGGTFTFGHETRLKAGGNIRMGDINFITHDGSDVPVIEAGGSIYLPDAVLYGPGRLWVQAGDEIWMGRTEGSGIRAREAYSIVPTAAPLSGGSISVLAGIDQEPEYQAFFDYYLDPENVAEAPAWLRQYFVDGDREGLTVSTDVVLADGQTRTTVYAIELVNYMREMAGQEPIPTEAFDEVSGSRPITRGKLVAEIDPAEYAEALAAFKALDPVLQRPLAVRILNAELKTAGREAVGRSPETDGRYVRQGDPTRGYDAVGRLFPGAQRKPGDTLAAGEHRWTGNIEIMVSQIRGESGGDVDLLAPGGSIQLASLAISNTNPGTAGIVTQRGGGVNVVTYGDYIVNQSRTMTADDGDILIWSSYGNIDAGRGRKTSLSVPPVAFPINAWGQTNIQLSGLPNGAGIATLDQVDGKQGGDVDLYAFNGIVNAGDAGIRASRDLFVGAVEIRGLDNITVGGETNVDLTTEEGSVGPLNLENFAQSAEDDALDKAFDMAAEVEKLRTVRQTILTGSVVSFGTDDCVESATNRCPVDRD